MEESNKLYGIYKICCDVSGVDIKRKKKDRVTYVYGRTCFFVLAIKLFPKITNSEIGKYVNKDHAAVNHALRKAKETYFDCEVYNKMLEKTSELAGVKKNSKKQMSKNEIISKLSKKVSNLHTKVELSQAKYKRFKRKKIAALLNQIPEDKEDDFIENRLKPYLLMNGVKSQEITNN